MTSCSISSVTSCNNNNANSSDVNQENETESGSNSLDDVEDKSEINSSCQSSSNFDTKTSYPRAILICKPNSHPFQERNVSLQRPVKIGRTLGKLSKQAPDNAFFEAKVLSRNHARLWYENGKFYIQDTNSSNGTFVNNQPLNENGDMPKEVFSNDTVQFGIEVVENSKQLAHSCIIASLKLFHPDGTEAKPLNDSLDSVQSSASNRTLLIFSQYLKEASQREKILQNKLITLTKIINETQVATENNWKSFVEEDNLLTKIESLQTRIQLLVESNQLNSDEFRYGLIIKLLNLHKRKENYKLLGKETIRSALNEKLRVLSENSKIKQSLNSCQEDYNRLKTLCDSYEQFMAEEAEKHDKLQKKLENMQAKCKTLEDKVESMVDSSKADLFKFESRENQLEETINNLKINYANALNEIKKFKLLLELTKNEESVFKEKCEKIEKKKESFPIIEKVSTQFEQPSLKFNQEFLDETCLVSLIKPNILTPLFNGEIKKDKQQLINSTINHNSNQNNDTSQTVTELGLAKDESTLVKSSFEENLNAIKLKKQEIDLNLKSIEELTLKAQNLEKENTSQNKKIIELEKRLKETNDVKKSLELKLADFNNIKNDLKNKQLVKESTAPDLLMTNQIATGRDYSIDNCLDSSNTLVLENNKAFDFNEKEHNSNQANLISSPNFFQNSKDELDFEQTNDLQSNQLEAEEENCESIKLTLLKEIEHLKEELELVSYQNKIASFVAFVPLLILSIAIIFAYYPNVSSVTGTLES